MFKRSFTSKDRAGKSVKPTKKIYREHSKVKIQESLDSPPPGRYVNNHEKLDGPDLGVPNKMTMEVDEFADKIPLLSFSPLTSPIITLVVGKERRLFAAHEDVLSRSPYFVRALKDQFMESNAKQVDLPDELVSLVITSISRR
jgi:hypothetical protein